MSRNSTPDSNPDKVRLDKWLWAARFYKTRSLAKTMIEGGKVQVDGQRVKASKEIQVGANVRLRQGFDEKTVAVLALSDRRGNATQAATLYEETAASLEKRALAAAARKSMGGMQPADNRPNKKQRRQIMEFKHRHDQEQDDAQ